MSRHDRTKPLPYIRICAGKQRGQYVHVLVAEAKVGRKLRSTEDVDHEDGDSTNNEWTNITVRDKSEHGRLTNLRRSEHESGLEHTETTVVAGTVGESGTRSKAAKRPRRTACGSGTASIPFTRDSVPDLCDSESGK